MARWIKIVWVVGSIVVLSGCAASAANQTRELISVQVQADQAYARQDCETAIPLYQELSDTLVQNEQVLLRLGNCLVRMQRSEEAIEVYRQAVDRDPTFVKAWYNLSYVQAQMLARTVAEMSANVDPTDPAAERARILATEILNAFRAVQQAGDSASNEKAAEVTNQVPASIDAPSAGSIVNEPSSDDARP